MRVLTDEQIESLKLRGYFKKEIDNLDNQYDILRKLENYNVSPIPYLLLFNRLDENGLNNLIRYICLNWQNVFESLKDNSIDFRNKSAEEICVFFLDENYQHRTYFFIEIIHQYFFP
ncbi:MAG: hypothetical protein CML47_01375 [Rhodobacteraceae bacterium]|jgi:hypothetical protein|nr:MAG: hypothetical protein CML47_01375 [Paracoccaceae bacterium]|tara:strand:+ start:8876 stop:9226 length:351 start_codon:yes stop_codon:yes gene_type:complete